MLEDATLDYQDTSKYATNAFLLAIIAFAQRIGVLPLLQQVQVPMKEVTHSVVLPLFVVDNSAIRFQLLNRRRLDG